LYYTGARIKRRGKQSRTNAGSARGRHSADFDASAIRAWGINDSTTDFAGIGEANGRQLGLKLIF
jgi:hypothetical protein